MDTVDSSHPARSAYLAQLAKLISDDPSRLAPESRRRVTEILSDLSLNSRSTEDLIGELAEGDAQLAELWDQVQREPPDVKRGGDLIRPGRRGRGPTHLWVCPVAQCERAEKGNGWDTISGKTRCDDHNEELRPVRIPNA